MTWIWKGLIGILILIVLMLLIWFPLVFFSLGSAVGEPNIPIEVSLDLRLEPFQPLYQRTTRHDSIHVYVFFLILCKFLTIKK